MSDDLCACHCCGLIQRLPALADGEQLRCHRCNSPLLHEASAPIDNTPALAAALSALILYIPAVTLPIMTLEQLGHAHESSLLAGGMQLIAHGSVTVGVVVLFCSIVVPLGKLIALVALALRPPANARHGAILYRIVEHLGRWGMVDIMLIAVLVAAVKLGSLASVSVGPAALLFTGMVITNILASLWFDTRVLWRPAMERQQ